MDMDKLYGFYSVIEKLKNVKRYSTNPDFSESTAEHSWKLAMMVMVTAKEMDMEMDLDKALKIALVHDLPEIFAGDVDNTLVYDGKVSVEEKSKNENDAIFEVTKELSDDVKDEIIGLWKEYESSITAEARLVRAMDKFEALSHMLLTSAKNKRLDHAVQYADDAVRNFPKLKPLLKIFKEKFKVEFEKNGLEWNTDFEKVLED